MCDQAEMRNEHLPNARLKPFRMLQIPRASKLHIYGFKCQVCVVSICDIFVQ